MREKLEELGRRKARLQGDLTPFEEAEGRLAYFEDSASVLDEEGGDVFATEIAAGLSTLEETIDAIEVRCLLTDPRDKGNALLTINPGAGGTESQDWAQMLMRMYLRWIERKGYEGEVLDIIPGEEAGIKSVTILVKGPYAYGYIKGEAGVHRLVRISPFDASKRRHTSFSAVLVYPEVEDDVEIEIRDEDLRVDTFRASGAGGQHVNKTSSAVRITHIPSGIVVASQADRSQHRNRDTAMKLLRSRLYDLQTKQKEKEMETLIGVKKEIAWGSQIRSYVLQPYRLIKDHRTGLEVGNVDAVLNGAIDEFIAAYLKSRK
jgi:peptide chain release factor 2